MANEKNSFEGLTFGEQDKKQDAFSGLSFEDPQKKNPVSNQTTTSANSTQASSQGSSGSTTASNQNGTPDFLQEANQNANKQTDDGLDEQGRPKPVTPQQVKQKETALYDNINKQRVAESTAVKNYNIVEQNNNDGTIKQLHNLYDQLQGNLGPTDASGKQDTGAIQTQIDALRNTPVTHEGLMADSQDSKRVILKSPYKTYGEMYDATQQAHKDFTAAQSTAQTLKAETDPAIQQKRKDAGYVPDGKDAQGNEYLKLNPIQSFAKGVGDAVNNITIGMMRLNPTIDRATVQDELKHQYIKDNVLYPEQPEGTLSKIAEVAGGVAPLIAATAIAPEGVGSALMNAAVFGTGDLGSGMKEGFNEGKAQGMSDIDAYDHAKKISDEKGITGTVLGGTMGLQSKLGGRLLLNEGEESAIKKFAGEQGVLVPTFMSKTLADNLYEKSQGSQKGTFDNVAESGASAFLIGLAGHAIANIPNLPDATRNVFENVMAKNYDRIGMVVDKMAESGVIDPQTAKNIQNKASAYAGLPKDMTEPQEEVAVPIVMKIQANNEVIADNAAVTATKEKAEIENEGLNRKLHETLNTPLSLDEQQSLGELKLRDKEKDDEGKLKKPLSDVERDLMEHLQARDDASRAAKKEPEKQSSTQLEERSLAAKKNFIEGGLQNYIIDDNQDGKTLSIPEKDVRNLHGLKGGSSVQGEEGTKVKLTSSENKQLAKIEADKELGDIDGTEYSKQKRELVKSIFQRSIDEGKSNTADAKTGIPVEQNAAYRTMDLGNDEGAKRTPESDKAAKERFLNGNTPMDGEGGKGETGKEFVGRVLTQFEKDKESEAHNTTVVTHSSVLKAIKAWEDPETWKEDGKPTPIPRDPANMSESQWKKFAEAYNNESTDNGDRETFKGKNGDIHVIRHGETEDNEKGNNRSGNTPLTEKGIGEGMAAGKDLNNATGGDVPKIISSDLPRALHTSDLVKEQLKSENADTKTLDSKSEDAVKGADEEKEPDTKKEEITPPVKDNPNSPINNQAERVTSAKNEFTDKELDEMGLSPIEKDEVKKNKETWGKVKADVLSGKVDPLELAKRVNDDPNHRLNDEETFALKYAKAMLLNSHDEANAKEVEANKSGDEQSKMEAIQTKALINDEYNQIAQALKSGGTEQGRALQARTRLVDSDYHMLEVQKRMNDAAEGQPIPEATRKRIEDLVQKNKEAEAKNKELENQKADLQKNAQIQHEINEQLKQQIKQGGKGRLRGDALISDGLQDLAKALGAIQSLDGEERPDVIKALNKIGRGLIDKGLASAENVWEKVKDYVKDKTGKDLPDTYKDSINIEAKDIKNVLRDKIDSGAGLKDMKTELKKMQRELVADGVKDPDELVKLITNELEKRYKESGKEADFGEREVRDAISGYGETRKPSQAELDKDIREQSTKMRLSSSKEDAVIGKAPLRSGYQPDKPTDEIRQLQKEVKQIMREKGIDDQRSPAERWKTALDAVKTRLKNQIADLTKQLETGAKTPAKKGIEYDAEAKALQKVRDDLKGALEKVEGKQKLTDEQRVKIAMEAAEKSLKEYQRRFVNKDFSPRETAKTPETPELKKLREQRDNAKEEYERQKKEAENLANPPKSKEEIATEAAIKSNKKSIEEKERRIKENDLSPSPKKEVADANNKELKDLRDKSDALDKQLQQMRNDAKVKKTEAEKTLERTKKSIEDLEKKIKDKDLADKIKSGVTTPEIEAAREKREKLAEELEKLKNEADPYREERKALEEWRKRKAAEIENKKDKLEKLKKGVLPEPPKPKVIPTSSEDLKIQAEAKKYKQDIDNEIARIKSANRSNFEKGLEWVSNWRRFAVLTGYHVLGKLAAAGVWQNAVVTPARKIIQTGLGKIPGLRGVAEKAPTEGNYSIQALSENYAQWFKKAAWDDVVNTAKTGKSQVKILNGNNEYHDKHFTDFIGNAHSAIKVLPERGEYFSSVQSASEWALRQGMDLTKPATQEMIHEIAYDNAQRNIFNNKNALSDGYKQMINHIAEKGGVGGRIAKTLLFDENLPIVKVPTNVLNDATSYTMGAVKAVVTGIETKFKVDNMTPEQADSIMRNLGKQTIGLIGLGIAKYLYHNLAGFHNKGEKKEMSGVEADKLKPGDVKVGDFKISHNFLHHPAFYGAQIAANIQRLMEAHASDKKKEGKEPFSLGDAILKSVSSVIKEIPMLESAASTFDVLKDTKSFKKALVETYVAGQIPQGLKEVAKDTDPEDKRSPQNVGQQLESNVPGLRESVPIPKDDFRDKNSWNKEKTYVVKGKQYIYDNNYWHLKK